LNRVDGQSHALGARDCQADPRRVLPCSTFLRRGQDPEELRRRTPARRAGEEELALMTKIVDKMAKGPGPQIVPRRLQGKE